MYFYIMIQNTTLKQIFLKYDDSALLDDCVEIYVSGQKSGTKLINEIMSTYNDVKASYMSSADKFGNKVKFVRVNLINKTLTN